MLSQRQLRHALATCLLACILLTVFTNAKPLRVRRAVAASSLSTKNSTSSSKIASSASAHTPSPTTQGAGIAAASWPTSAPLSFTCEAFVLQCYKTALAGQKGDVTVTHSCQRTGPTSYAYSCTANFKTITAKVLEALAHEFGPPSYTTIEDLHVVTDVIEDVSTVYDTTTQSTTGTSTITATSWTELIDVDVLTVPFTTLTSTSVVPYTVSSTASATSTETEVISTTATALTTQTQVLVGTGVIPVTTPVNGVAVQEREELSRRAEGRRVVSVTITGTTTTYVTSSRTTTLPTTVLTATVVTQTSTTDETSTVSSTSTATLGTSTLYTPISSAAATDVTTTYVGTTTTSSTTTIYVTTTTKIVLAATGFVHAFDTTTGDDLGILGHYAVEEPYAQIYPDSSLGLTVECMAVRDGPTGLYQLATLGDPTTVFFQNPNLTPIFMGGGPDWAPLQYGGGSICGSNADGAGPVTQDAGCETFIFSPVALDSTPGATEDTVNLYPYWINPQGTYPATWTGSWAHFVNHQIMNIADKAAYDYSQQPPDNYFYLRFPFTS